MAFSSIAFSSMPIGIAAVPTAIEYEYRPPRRTEYRFAEYEYEEIQSEARSSYIPHRVERPPEGVLAIEDGSESSTPSAGYFGASLFSCFFP